MLFALRTEEKSKRVKRSVALNKMYTLNFSSSVASFKQEAKGRRKFFSY